MVTQISGLSPSSLYQLKTLNNHLFNEIEKISSGKYINQASDDPSGYYSSKLLEQEIILSESEAKKTELLKNASSTKSSKLENLSDMLNEIENLGHDASLSLISDSEKDIIQDQVNNLLNNLKEIMQSKDLSSLENFGVDINDIILNGSDTERSNAILKIEKFFENVVSQNTKEGSNFNSLNRKLETLQPIINNLKSSLSSLNDVDLANESIKLSQQKIMTHLGMQGVKTASEVAKSTLDLFG